MGKIILCGMPDHADLLTNEEKQQAVACGARTRQLHDQRILVAIFGNPVASRYHHYFLKGHRTEFWTSLNLDYAAIQTELLRALGSDPHPGATVNRWIAQELANYFTRLNDDHSDEAMVIFGSPDYLQPILEQLGRICPEPSPVSSLSLGEIAAAHYRYVKVSTIELLPRTPELEEAAVSTTVVTPQ